MREPTEGPAWSRVLWSIRIGIDPANSDIQIVEGMYGPPPREYLDWKARQSVIDAIRMNRDPNPDDVEQLIAADIDLTDEYDQWRELNPPVAGQGGRPYWDATDEAHFRLRMARCLFVDRLRSLQVIGRHYGNRLVIGLDKACEVADQLIAEQLRAAARKSDRELVGFLDSLKIRRPTGRDGGTTQNFYRSWWRPTPKFVAVVREQIDELTLGECDLTTATRQLAKVGFRVNKGREKYYLPAALIRRIHTKGLGLSN